MARTEEARTSRAVVLILGAVFFVQRPVNLWLGFPCRGAAPGKVSLAGLAKDEIFTPVSQGAKVTVGTDQIKQNRSPVIKMGGDLMVNGHVDFGYFALKKLFQAADNDGSGRIDREELKGALNKRGFSWVDEVNAAKVASKGVRDGDGLIDFKEFKKLAPSVLRLNLMKPKRPEPRWAHHHARLEE